MNPFQINAMPVDNPKNLYCRQEAIEELRSRVDNRIQTVILGPEGVGKTSLLKSAFDRDYRIEKAKGKSIEDGTDGEKERVLISPVTEFPFDSQSDEIYDYFAEMIVSSVNILAECGEEELAESILSGCEKIRDGNDTAQIRFEKIVGYIHNRGYKIVMLVDNFERFTTSMEVTMNHHESLRRLLDCLQFIVATNYDLNKDSLPPKVSGSFLLMCFAGSEISLRGWTEEEAGVYIRAKLHNCDVEFSEELLDKIYTSTAGIPKLLNIAANNAYTYILKNKTEEGLDFESMLAGNDIVRALFARWCKIFGSAQITAMQHLLGNNYFNDVDSTKLRALYMRGIIDFRVVVDQFGNKIVKDNEYQFCGTLFRNFCMEESAMELAASKNPLLLKHGDAPVQTPPEDTVSEEAIADVVDIAKTKKVTLETQLREAEARIDEDIDNYRNLGAHISEKSERLKRLEKQYDKISDLKIEIESKFELIIQTIRMSESASMLLASKRLLEKTYTGLEQELKAIKRGTV